jgi:hypothetical protein
VQALSLPNGQYNGKAYRKLTIVQTAFEHRTFFTIKGQPRIDRRDALLSSL